MAETRTPPAAGNTDRLDLLVCGKTGVGKSSLVNFLIGEEVCKVGDVAEVKESNALSHTTKKVGRHVTWMNGTLLQIYDSPGLQDGTPNDEAYVQDMYDKCKDADLVFYCLEAIDSRWLPRELAAIEVLTKKFGAEFWKKAVLVLTKANMVQPRLRGQDPREYFDITITALHRKFLLELTKAGVPNLTAADVPVVAVGSDAVQVLADGKSFIRNLWLTSHQRVPADKQKAFIKATNMMNRVIPADTAFVEIISQQLPQHGYDAKCYQRRKLLASRMSEPPPPYSPAYPIPLERKDIALVATGVATTTTAGAVTGAVIGGILGVVGGPPGVAIGAIAGVAAGAAFGGMFGAIMAGLILTLDSKDD